MADEIDAFLQEPLRMAQVAAVSPRQAPLLGSLWFVFEDDRFWFNSHPSSPLVRAAKMNEAIAVIVDDFTPPERIRQVRVRGQGRIDRHDVGRVRRIYDRYLGPQRDDWPDFFKQRAGDSQWNLWSVSPDSGVATANPNFRAGEVRWSAIAESPL